MSAQIAAYGRLVSDPRPIETRSGKAMTAARLAVSVECRDGGETGEETLWLSVLAFGRCAEDLARHAKGEPVSVSGRVRLERYVAGDGEERETWQVLADAVVSSRSVRPRGGGAAGAARTAARQDRTRTAAARARRGHRRRRVPPRRTSTTISRSDSQWTATLGMCRSLAGRCRRPACRQVSSSWHPCSAGVSSTCTTPGARSARASRIFCWPVRRGCSSSS